MVERDIRQVDTDVAVIGCGAAGLRAAIEVAACGKRALLISKGPAGGGCCTAMSGGMFSGAMEGMSPEEHLARTLKSGCGINVEDLVRTLCAEGPGRIDELIGWGLAGARSRGCFFSSGKPPWVGRGIIDILLGQVRSKNIPILANSIAAEILVRENRAAGVLVYDWKNGRFTLISAGSVILATGGAGALFEHHDNPERMLGDGYGLAFRAGARLVDMEFVQFYPLGLFAKGRAPFPLPAMPGEWGVLSNDRGEEIHEKYGLDQRPAALRMRDELSRAVWTELYEHNSAVYCDISNLPDGKWSEDPLAFSCKDYLIGRYAGSRGRFTVRPMAHHTMGGVMIDACGASSVTGLFAAGEAAGGVHGANRMGGNALTEALVFGTRAGRSAARRESGTEGTEDLRALAGERQHFFSTAWKKTGGTSPRAVRRELRKLMWEGLGIVRTAGGIERAAQKTAELSQRLEAEVSAGNPRERMEAMEAYGALLTGRAVCAAALMRTESRGAHFRKDHPRQDDRLWKEHIVLELGPGGNIRRASP